MNGRFLLDTNIVIALWANDEAVTQQMATANEVFIPSIVLGELYYGARKSAWSAKNIARIDEFALQEVQKEGAWVTSYSPRWPCVIWDARHAATVEVEAA